MSSCEKYLKMSKEDDKLWKGERKVKTMVEKGIEYVVFVHKKLGLDLWITITSAVHTSFIFIPVGPIFLTL